MRAQDESRTQALRDHLKLEGTRRKLRDMADRAYRAAQLPDPSPLEPLCIRHDWNPEPPMPGAPRPPCPQCRAEAEPPAETGSRQIQLDYTLSSLKETPTMRRKWDEYKQRQEKPHPPGSFAAQVEQRNR